MLAQRTNPPRGGRPIGWMLAWLNYGTQDTCPDARSHMEFAKFSDFFAWEERAAARADFMDAHGIEAVTMATWERPKEEAEEEEPYIVS